MSKITRELYNKMYGPTVGDKIRLADTELWIEVEKDFTSYGEELKFGTGKVVRDGMGQGQMHAQDCMDLVLTNALIVDYWGIIKADIGINKGRIAAIGKAGNPDIQSGINILIGPATEIIAAEGKIVTAGGVDTHVHFICPQQIEEAICSGITTMIGGGTGPTTSTNATNCTSGLWHLERMLQAVDTFPVNIGLIGKGSSSSPDTLKEQILLGAIGLKLHEDWGVTSTAINCCLNVAEKFDVQVTIHTDSMNEAGFVQDTITAVNNRTIHAYHTEGAGGGHIPDIICVCAASNILPSSTTPTIPYTIHTFDEHLDMLMICHNLNYNIAEDIAFAQSRIRSKTIAAENVLHDLGALSMISSDSQAMGRVGEVILRTWQCANQMKLQRGALIEDTESNDNFRVKRYIAKYTINPAITHGISHEVGSIESGKLADLVLWSPAFFGIKPSLVIKGGMIAVAPMGDPNGSISTSQPVHYRSMFGTFNHACHTTRMTFMSSAACAANIAIKLKLSSLIGEVHTCRTISKKDMIHNCFQPNIKVDCNNYEVYINDEILTCEPAKSLPMTQRYFLF